MPELTLPEGRYLTCPVDVGVDTGGQTRALLMRNRIFAAAAGVRPSVLSFGAAADLPRRREILLERGLLTREVDLLNIYEHYRDTDWEHAEQQSERPLRDLTAHLAKESSFPDGSPWRRTYRPPHSDTVLYDYLRPDGTTYLRIPGFIFKQAATWPKSLLRVSRAGHVVGEYKSVSGWFRQYLRELSIGHDRTFVFVDSRYIAPFLAPMRAPNIHLIYLLHNIHVTGERRWDSPATEIYGRLLSLVGSFDAFVTLTDRQRQDIAQRLGRRNNMFVVPNPVDIPPPPDERVQRDPRLVTVVARLEGQKRLSHAIKAFKRVVTEVPDARLEIWGSGSRGEGLQRFINRLGVQDSVTLRGHDPLARDALWRSSAMIMTSLFEGYPLSTLESLSHGCPVVSYDIKYGPREQLTDGVDGFLVAPGDTAALAERLITLLRDPALVARMSTAALETAHRHGTQRFMADWSDVVNATMELKPRRAHLDHVDVDVHRLTIRRWPGPRWWAGRHRPSAVGTSARVNFECTVLVDGRSRRSDLAEATIELDAVHSISGSVVTVPLEVQRDGHRFRVSVNAPVDSLYPDGLDSVEECRLRIRLIWQNAVWETVVRRPPTSSSDVEVSYLVDDELRLIRR